MRLLTSISWALALRSVAVSAAPGFARPDDSHRALSGSQKNNGFNGTQRPGQPELASPLVFREYDLVIDNTPVAPDGFLRSAVVAGLLGQPGTFPGPTITAQRGENLRINVINELTDPTMRRSTTIVSDGDSPAIRVVGISMAVPHR
jgi:hypothetical protein